MQQRLHHLDSLRAVAVLLVVFAHAGVPGMAGGWIGVDVFFVLSGYLITKTLLQQEAEGTFSYTGFWIRRVRRLAPAFVFTAIASAAAFFLVMPDRVFLPAMVTLAWSAVGAANIQQSLGSSYFDDDGAMNPYTHLWSLGVEEQFYLLFPFVFFVLIRRHRALAFLAAGIASYALLLVYQANPATYFWPWTRAWGLLLGVVLAVATAKCLDMPFPGWAGAGGLLAIPVIALAGNSAGEHWPVFAALAALASTIFIASKVGKVATVLMHPAITAVGVASYSIYLVHQPLLVLAHVWTGGYPLGPALQLITIAAILAAGWWMRRFVEEPYLHGKGLVVLRRGGLAHLLVFVVGATSAVGTWSSTRESMAGVWGGESIEKRLATNTGASPYATGIGPNERPDTPAGATPRVHLWGDSHAMHYAQALLASDVEHEQWTMSACPPTNGVAVYEPGGKYDLAWAKSCGKFNREVFDHLLSLPQPGTLVVASFAWMINPHTDTAWDDRLQASIALPRDAARVEMALRATVETLHAKGWNIITLPPNPAANHNPGRCNTLMAWTNRDAAQACSFLLDDPPAPKTRVDSIQHVLHTLDEEGLTTHIDTWPILCPNGRCLAARDGVFVWRDAAHLSKEGSAWLGQQESFRQVLSDALAKAPAP